MALVNCWLKICGPLRTRWVKLPGNSRQMNYWVKFSDLSALGSKSLNHVQTAHSVSRHYPANRPVLHASSIQWLQLNVLQHHGKARCWKARDAQSEARETFRSSLERFQSVVDTPNTGLQEKYDVISGAV